MNLSKSYKGLIRPGDVIKHEKFMDVAVLVYSVGVLEVGATSIQIYGTWMNQGYVRSWVIGDSTDFSIKVEDLSKWYLCVDEQKDQCLRKCDWIPLGYK